LQADCKLSKNKKRKIYKTFVSKYFCLNYLFCILAFDCFYLQYHYIFNLKVRVNLLNPASLESAQQVRTIFLDPLPGFDDNNLKGVWLYEGENPLPPHAKSQEASSLLFPTVIGKNDEVIIRDRKTNEVVVAIYRNRIGPEALQIMRETIIEMMKVRRKVARSGEISKYNQGTMTAAGYLF